MRIADPPIAANRIAEFVAGGYWRETTSNDALEHFARLTPDKRPRLPKLKHVLVVAAGEYRLPDPRLGERVCACVVTRDGQQVDFAEVVEFLRRKVATYKLPEHLVLLDDLPRTPTGKVQKTPLRQIAIDKLGSRLPPAQSRAGRKYQQ